MKKLKLLKIYSLICIFALVTVYELISLLFLHETSSLVLLADTYHNFFTLLSLILLVISHKVSRHTVADITLSPDAEIISSYALNDRSNMLALSRTHLDGLDWVF